MIRSRQLAATGTAALALLMLGALVGAQGPGRGPGPGPGGPDGNGRRGFGGPPVPNEPYSGTEISTFTQTLPDGNTIAHSSCRKVYRDSAGDTREEVTPNATTCASTPQFIAITNLAAALRYEINLSKSSYFQMKLGTSLRDSLAGPPASERAVRNEDQVQQTSLGTEPIAGTSLSAEGTQRITTIPAGKIGNTQPITITSTRWYSPDLHVVIRSSMNDPRGGNRAFQLGNVSTAEPAASLFQLPAGLTLEPDHRGGRGPHGPPPPAAP